MITVKVFLFADLADYVPQSAEASPFLHTMEDDSTVEQLFIQLGLPREHGIQIFVNNLHCGSWDKKLLRDGDSVAIFPFLIGG